MKRITLIFMLSISYLMATDSIGLKLELNRAVIINGGFAYQENDSVYIVESLYEHYNEEVPKLIAFQKKEVLFRDDKRYGTKGYPFLFGDSKILIQRNLTFPVGEKLMTGEINIFDLLSEYNMFPGVVQKSNYSRKLLEQSYLSSYHVEIYERYDGMSYSSEVVLKDYENNIFDSYIIDGIVTCTGIKGESIYIGTSTWGNLGLSSEFYIFNISLNS